MLVDLLLKAVLTSISCLISETIKVGETQDCREIQLNMLFFIYTVRTMIRYCTTYNNIYYILYALYSTFHNVRILFIYHNDNGKKNSDIKFQKKT